MELNKHEAEPGAYRGKKKKNIFFNILLCFITLFYGCSNSSKKNESNKNNIEKKTDCTSITFIDFKKYPLNTKLDLERVDSIIMTTIYNEQDNTRRNKIEIEMKSYDKQLKSWSFRLNIDTISILAKYKFDFFLHNKIKKSFLLTELQNGKVLFYANGAEYFECGLVRYVLNNKEYINHQNITF